MTPPMTAQTMFWFILATSLEHAGAPDRAVERVAHGSADDRRHQPLPEEEDHDLAKAEFQHDHVETQRLHHVDEQVGCGDVDQERYEADVGVALQVRAE